MALLFLVFFVFGQEVTQPSDIISDEQPPMPYGAKSGILSLKGKKIEDLPYTFNSLENSRVKLIFNFGQCKYNEGKSCDAIDGELDLKKLRRIEKKIFEIANKKTKKWDEWAKRNLHFWVKIRGKVLPIRIILNPADFFENAGVSIGTTGEPISRVLSIEEKHPEMELGTKGALDDIEFMNDVISHELGHILHNKMRIQSHTGRFTETFGDLTFSLLNDGKSNFGGKAAAQKFQKFAKSNSDNPLVLHQLNMSSKNGIRDFASSSSPSYAETFSFPHPYRVSALVNRTLYLLRDQVSPDLASKLFFQLAHESPDVFSNPDPRFFMQKFRRKLEKNKTPINWRKFDKVLVSLGWHEPKKAPAPGIDEFMFSSSGSKYSVSLAHKKGVKPKHRGKSVLLLANGKPAHDSFCFTDKCAKPMDFRKVKVCQNPPCKCFDGPISLTAKYLFSKNNQVYESKAEKIADKKLSPGCYKFGINF